MTKQYLRIAREECCQEHKLLNVSGSHTAYKPESIAHKESDSYRLQQVEEQCSVSSGYGNCKISGNTGKEQRKGQLVGDYTALQVGVAGCDSSSQREYEHHPGEHE